MRVRRGQVLQGLSLRGRTSHDGNDSERAGAYECGNDTSSQPKEPEHGNTQDRELPEVSQLTPERDCRAGDSANDRSTGPDEK